MAEEKVKDPKKVIMGRTNKGKGAKWERDVCKALENKFKKIMKDDEEFKRAPLSGGWSKRNKHTFGDIVTPEWFIMVVSCKNVKKFDITNLISLGTMPKYIKKYLKETLSMSEKTGKEPLLVVNVSKRGSLAFFKCNPIKQLMGLTNQVSSDDFNRLYFEDWIIVSWSDLLKCKRKYFMGRE
jgi:hypothetical protein